MSENNGYDIAILHSLSGPMEISERALVNSSLLAVDEINSEGGILGKQIIPHVYDGASDPDTFYKVTQEAVDNYGCRTYFGTWMSSSRKAVLPLLSENNAMLWYPLQYEGLELSDNVVYTGSCLNQQIEPALKWCSDENYCSYFLIGSNYVYPHTANRLISSSLKSHNCNIAGEFYTDIGEVDFAQEISEILESGCDIIINTLNGSSNTYFLEQLEKRAKDRYPAVMSFSFSELENSVYYEKLYACWSYFQTLNTDENIDFIKKYKNYCTRNNLKLSPVSDPVVTAYSQIYLWKKCVEDAGSFDADAVKKVLPGTSVKCPFGSLELHNNHHVLRQARIGKANKKGTFDIIHDNGSFIEPLPWLGMEKMNFSTVDLIKDTISRIPEEINYKIELNRKSIDLEYEKQKYEHLVDNMQSGVAVYKAVDNGADFVFIDYNRAGSNMDGMQRGNVIGHRLLETFPSVKEFGLFDVIYEVWKTGKAVNHPISLYNDHKLSAWRENYVYRLPSGEVVAVYNDVTEKMRIQNDLEKLNKRYSLAAESAHLGVWELDLGSNRLLWDEWMFKLYHLSPDDFSSDYEAWKARVHPEDLEKTEIELQKTIAGNGIFDTTFRIIIPGNEIRYIQANAILTVDRDNKPVSLTGVNYDITDRKIAELKIREYAVKDPLTSVYNRRYLFERLEENIEEYRRNNKALSLAIIDIDHFKKVNDSFGHSCGDIVLKNFAKIISNVIRPYDFICRYGGEEFVIVFYGADKEAAVSSVSRILNIVRNNELVCEDNIIKFTFSAGIIDAEEISAEKLTAESMVNEADNLLYRAKESGRNRIETK